MYEIRIARWEDITAMLRIERANFGERAFTRQQFRHYIMGRCAYVVVDNFVLYGYIVLFVRAKSKTARINVVSVDPKHTGKGFGSLLLDYAETKYSETYDYMGLEVNADNLGAIRLYKGRGYNPKKVLPNYYGEGTTGIKMVKQLK